MTSLVLRTNTITGNEKAWALFEINEQSPDNQGFHRYQIVQVIRDGRITEWRRDMGLTSNYKGVNQLRIPSLLEHSVDELFALADELRNEREVDLAELLQTNAFKLG